MADIPNIHSKQVNPQQAGEWFTDQEASHSNPIHKAAKNLKVADEDDSLFPLIWKSAICEEKKERKKKNKQLVPFFIVPKK